MRSEHYYLPTVGTANPVGNSSLGLFLYPRSATLVSRLVLSHRAQSVASWSRGKGDGVALGAVLLACYLSGLTTALPITSIVHIPSPNTIPFAIVFSYRFAESIDWLYRPQSHIL